MVLYRKYRPYLFSKVIGQEHIVRTLKNQIKSGRIAHAYLFSGSRGTGKTTVAKIFARAVNCESPVDGSACGSCETCQKISEGTAMNIIEIDAASHNGVDNIREINEEVKYAPAIGRYKVYIIDEVHMLSIGAFNALLKTLEEPPKHIIFILATTDPQKIPVTIISRCQRFEFKRISIEEIKETMKTYMAKEQIQIEDEALEYIAQLADGGMRDALSLLEQSISFYEDELITTEKIQDLVGSVDRHLLFEMIEAIRTQNVQEALNLCDKIYREGRHLRQFVLDLMKQCRNLLIVKTTEHPTLEYSKPYIEKLKAQADLIEVTELMRYMKQLSTLESELRTTLPNKILLEMALLKLCEVQMDDSIESMQTKLKLVEQKLEKLMQMPTTSKPKIAPQNEKKIVPTKLPEAVPDEVKSLVARWQEVLQKLEKQTARAYCSSMQLGYIEGDVLYIIYKGDMEPKTFLEDIQKAVNQVAQREVKLRPIRDDAYAQKSIQVYGSHPKAGEEVKTISNLLDQLQSKINFKIDVT